MIYEGGFFFDKKHKKSIIYLNKNYYLCRVEIQ